MAGDDVRRTVIVVAALAILGLLALAGATHYLGESGGAVGPDRPNATMVEPIPNGSDLWPYTSRSRGYGGRTLAINVIAVGDTDRVRQEFSRQVEANWSTRPYPTANESETADNVTGDGRAPPVDNVSNVTNETRRPFEVLDQEIVWLPAHGATRYSYVRSPAGEGTWLAESYQLYDGAYLGDRHHVRAYESPHDDWTAMQSHREYWDWFRLRHTVTSTADTQRYVDVQFLDDERVEQVYKVHLKNGDKKDGNGWATVIEFAVLGGLLLGAGRYGRVDRMREGLRAWLDERQTTARRVGTVFLAVAGLYLAVRVGGVVLEGQFRDVSPKVIAGALYPVLALGLPTVAYLLSRGLRPEDAFVGAVAGFVAAFVIEYGYLGLEVIPVELLLHRVALLLALGIVAAAGALSSLEVEDASGLLAIGVAGWIVALGLPLLGLV